MSTGNKHDTDILAWLALWVSLIVMAGALMSSCASPAASGPGCVRRTSRERRVLVVRPECPPGVRADGGR